MNKTIIGVVVLLIIVAGGWYLVSKNQSTSNETGPVKIGVILPLTGDAAVYGEPLSHVLQIAADEINAASGIDGQQVNLVVEDGKCNGTDAANAAQKLVNVDHVQVIIGGFCSGESLSAEPIATAGKVALLSGGSSSPKLTDISPYFARDYPSDSFQGKILAGIAYTDKGWKKVATIQEQTDYALGVYTAFSTEFTRLGGVVTNESFPSDNTDFRTIVSKMKVENPDAVLVSVQTPATAARVFTQMNQLGWKPKLLIVDAITGDPITLANNKAILEGAITAEFGVDPTNAKFSGMIASYKTKYGAEPPYQSYAQTMYDAVYLVRDAIKAVGYDGTKIANWLRTSVKGWQGASGSVTIGENGDPTVGHKPEIIVGGKVVPYVK
jgi:branched-chain amino acid transport system substrate-binding protein